MRVLERGLHGSDVQGWQVFLHRQGFDPGDPDGDFGIRTDEATRAFQSEHGLVPDGMVGRATMAVALTLGFNALSGPADPSKEGPFWPPKPGDLQPLVSNVERAAVFGSYQFESDPQPGDREHIRILGDWEARNIDAVEVPQLLAVSGAPRSGKIQFHRLGARQLQQLWQSWEAAGLLDRILAWDGSFNPRFVRNSRSLLSNHAFGSAFDINADWNPYHKTPALVGKAGCVRELVEIANDNGFFWGGHFSQPDGMHFEIAKLL